MTREVIRGPASAQRIPALVAARGARSVFLVTGRASYHASGAEDALSGLAEAVSVVHFSDFGVNPRLEEIERGLARARDAGCDLVVGIGGGSVLDVAKAVALCLPQSAAPVDLVLGNAEPESDALPIIAAPTTAGTGSESTHFAVVYIDERKHSLAHASMLPAVAVVDPTLSHSLPPAITAACGLDALCQAIEAMWSVHSTDESREYSRRAIRLVYANLPDAVHRPDPHVRAAMSEGAHLAGMAINIAKTTAAHALSYVITSKYHVAHGHAVALSLAPLIVHNGGVSDADVVDPRGTDFVRAAVSEVVALLGSRSAAEAADAFRRFVRDVGLPVRLGEVGIETAEARAALADTVNTQRLANNPRRLTADGLRALLDAAR